MIGGNGSLAGAHAFSTEVDRTGTPLRVMGIPASIDNELAYTTMAILTDTAQNTIVDAIGRIADTASSHARAFIVEVMGRNCGYLALATAVATEADGVLLREAQGTQAGTIGKLGDIVRRACDPARGRHRVLIVKSEGVAVESGDFKAALNQALAATGHPVETQVTVLD